MRRLTAHATCARATCVPASQVERVAQKKQAEEQMLRAAFARLDEDGSGTLDKKEVSAIDQAGCHAAGDRL